MQVCFWKAWVTEIHGFSAAYFWRHESIVVREITRCRVKAGRHRKWQWLQAHHLERNHAVMRSLLLLSVLGEGDEREEE